jgi:lipid II:glycine glycyltransferase (peptidoglycan interpeptide bridge formation enzyme)
MFVVREVTDLVDEFEDLVTNTENRDYIDDQEKELLESVGEAFSADGGYLW